MFLSQVIIINSDLHFKFMGNTKSESEDNIEIIYLEKDQYMSDIFPDGLPTNAIIDKTVTASGGTTCELETDPELASKSLRNSIIIEPNVPVIDGKQAKFPKALGVREGVTDARIMAYMKDKSIDYKKIIVTPESYSKVKRVAEYADIDLFNDYFLLIDECEKVVQDSDYRPDIVLPFFDFFNFKDKAIISATPLYPSLKGFTNHKFRHIKIVPNYDYKKIISLIGTNKVEEEFLTQISINDNKKAIFLNSIKYAKSLINKTGIKDRSKIYCSDQNDAIKKLNDEGYKAAESFESDSTLEQYNFFTSRFYSAVDLETSDKPDVIMVTDCFSRSQSMIDPFTHAVQITGRFRLGIGNITHITNWNSNLNPKSREEIIKEILDDKAFYDRLLTFKEASNDKQKNVLKEITERLNVYPLLFKSGEYKGKINPFLLECSIQKSKVESFYQQLSALKQAYTETGHFNVLYHYSPYKKKESEDTKESETENKPAKSKPLSRERKLEILDRLRFITPGIEAFKISTNEEEIELAALRDEAPVLCKYYAKFGIEKIVEIDYDLNIMKRQLKASYREEIFFKPLDEIHNSFVIGKAYSEAQIMAILQRNYDDYNLVDDNNKPLKAEKATYLKKYFEISTRVTVPNTREKGYIPLSKKYSLE